MSLNTENISLEILRDIFRTHPMWNYNYYLIIDYNDGNNNEPIGIGFKKVNIFDREKNEYIDIVKAEINSIMSNQNSFEVICENGLTHDGSIHKFIDNINNGSETKHNILLMEIEKSEGDYKERVEKGRFTITSVKHTWVLENTYPLNWETSGFDAMSNEIFIQKVQFAFEGIEVIEMTEEIAKDKARGAVSKLY